MGQSVTDTFLYDVSDGNGGTASAQLSIKIDGVNDAPVIAGDKAITVAEGGSVIVTTADLTANDPDNAAAQLVFTVTGTSHGSVRVNGTAATSFTKDDLANNRVSFLHAGGDADGNFSASLSDGTASGGSVTVTATVDPHANDAPVVGNITLPSIEVNSGAKVITSAQLLANTTDIDERVADRHRPAHHDGAGHARQQRQRDLDLHASAQRRQRGELRVHGVGRTSCRERAGEARHHTFAGRARDRHAGDDAFTAPGTGNSAYNGRGGVDTVTFGFKLVDAHITFSDNQVTIDGPTSRTVLTGFEKFVFTDGTVNNSDGSPLVDDLFYYANNHDVWNAHVDADLHYSVFGWKEGAIRTPSSAPRAISTPIPT